MKKIIFWGGTGQAKVLYDALDKSIYNLIAIIDNQLINSPIKNIPIFCGEEGLNDLIRKNKNLEDFYYAVTIGGNLGTDRLKIAKIFKNLDITPLTIIHNTAFIAEGVNIGEGCQVLANSSICASAQIGKYVILNTNCSVDHDCIINDGSHIGPGAHLAGEIKIGKNSFVGVGATILPKLEIGDNVVMGGGSVVTKNIPNNSIVYGNPARIMSTNNT